MQHYQYLEGQIALVELCVGKTHVLNQLQRQQLFDALLHAEQDSQVKAVILAGKDGVFSIGGDLEEFSEGQAFVYPHLCDDILYLLEHYQKPTVAALAGFALGGGLELALACDARVSLKDTLLGLPETKLGLIPGGQGTQRIVRALGIERGLSLMLSGEMSKASTFENTPLLQSCVENHLIDAALQCAKDLIQSEMIKKLSQIKLDPITAQPLLDFAQLQTRAYPHNNIALNDVINVVKVGVEKGFIAGCEAEAKAFEFLIQSNSSKALRHLFFAEKATQKTPSQTSTGLAIQNIVVIGAGFMGQGIASCLNRFGLNVQLFDVNTNAADQAVQRIRVKSKHTEKIQLLQSLEQIQNVDLVIEAVSENLALKQQIFTQLGELCNENVLLASNTSSLDLNKIAEVVQHPERVLGLHFFGPVEHMKLLEVVQGRHTKIAAMTQAKFLAKKINKVPVISQVGPGFIGNRIFDAYLYQALNLLALGISPQSIDQAMCKWGMKMGPFQVMDLIGNDLLLSAWAGKFNGEGIDCLKRLVSAQYHGQKVQKGWYHYIGKNIHFDSTQLSALIQKDLNGRLATDQIVQRLILSLYVEAQRVLDDGIAKSSADIDLVFVHGYGFPAEKGGPVHYIEQHFSAALVQRQIGFYASQGQDGFWQYVKTSAVLENIA